MRLFAAVAQEGSITAGARHVHLSLAAATTRLQNLEHAIGAVLMRRSRQGVALTDAGRTLLRHAARLQRELVSLHAEMAAYAQGVHSTVRVLCNTAAMIEHLPRRLGRFLVRHPDIDIDLREPGSHDVLVAMRQEQADIGIMADYVSTDGLQTQAFGVDHLVVLPAAPGRPAESGLSRFLHGKALLHGRGLHHRVRVNSLEGGRPGGGSRGRGHRAQGRGAAAGGGPDGCASAPRRVGQAGPLLCTAGDVPLGAGAAALRRFLAEPA
ncbi:MAG TPA: LysR family transcriptional regulator [Burkholderiaceae bacterium]|nr:LysR family transcriptional regulator [Burkholderiaceae bacterium]